jgi:hypothetical protein
MLLHDNAHPHIAAWTAEIFWKLKYDVIAHSLQSLDLVSYDCHLFGPLKVALKGHRFTLNQEVKEAACTRLPAQPETFFSEVMWKHVQQWTKHTEKHGNYVEK